MRLVSLTNSGQLTRFSSGYGPRITLSPAGGIKLGLHLNFGFRLHF
jgi:hypothetical protein